MSGAATPLEGPALTEAISAAVVALYARHYGHDRTTASTFINDDVVVVCILEDILSTNEARRIGDDDDDDDRVAFQTETEDEFTAAVERLTCRRVVAFLSANQTSPGVASEPFFLEPRARVEVGQT